MSMLEEEVRNMDRVGGAQDGTDQGRETSRLSAQEREASTPLETYFHDQLDAIQ